MEKLTLTLQPTEAAVFRAAANIYAAYVAGGRFPHGQEQEYIERSIQEALQIAQRIDELIQSDEEVG